MWPWEHLAVGYLAYSLLVRAGTGRAPHGRLVMAALFVGTQFPDLVDKPLAWMFGLLPSGTSLAHSVFVAVPLVTLFLALSWLAGRPSIGRAFGVGYLLHLPADVLYVALYGSPVNWTVLLWPLYTAPAGQDPGLLANVALYFGKFLEVAVSPAGRLFVAAELLLLGGALVLWVLDGFPGIRASPPRRGHTTRY